MAIKYLELMNEITRDLPPLPIAHLGPPTIAPMAKPLAHARVLMISSAGVHLRSEPPFAPTNDLSFRRVPTNADPSSLRPSHPAPVRRPGEVDINVVHPYQRLNELADSGVIGGTTTFHISILGAIKKLTELVTDLGPRIARAAVEAGADLVLVVPLCPACHQACGIVARVLETFGIPTVSLTSARDITARVRPPRAAFLDFPLGNSCGAPNDVQGQLDIVRSALELASNDDLAPGSILDLPFAWPHPQWEQECIDLYRREASIVLRQRLLGEYDSNGTNTAQQACRDVCSLI